MAFNDIAVVRIESGRRRAIWPVTVFEASAHSAVLFCYFALDENRDAQFHVVDTLGGLYTDWLDAVQDRDSGHRTDAYFTLPKSFRDEGRAVDATAEIDALSSSDAQYTIVLVASGNEFENLVITGHVDGIRIGGDTVDVMAVTKARFSNLNLFSVGTVLTDLRASPLDSTFRGILPTVPGYVPRNIWVEREDVIGDFQSLVLTTSGDVQSAARKTTRLRTAYLPELEDLDTHIEYGVDADGEPILWAVVGTERGSRDMILNLEAVAT